MNWLQSSCALQGRMHFEEGIPCQDKTFSYYNNNTYIIALADGASSAEYSHYGADVVVESICKYIAESFDELLQNSDALYVKTNIINYLIGKLEQESIKRNCEINELASTLLFAAVKDDKFFIGHIGDGVIGYLKNKDLKVISTPQSGEYANTTFFVTSNKANYYLRIYRGNTNDVSGFFLMSDGSSNCLYQKKKKQFSPVIFELMQQMLLIGEAETELLLKENFEFIIEHTETGDDCSISLMCRETKYLKPHEKTLLIEKCELFPIEVLKINNKIAY